MLDGIDSLAIKDYTNSSLNTILLCLERGGVDTKFSNADLLTPNSHLVSAFAFALQQTTWLLEYSLQDG